MSHTLDVAQLDSDRRNASTQMRASKKLNKFTLDLLPDVSEAGDVQVDSHAAGPQRLYSSVERGAAQGNNFRSTFSQFYLNDRYKDLLSIGTAGQDRQTRKGAVAGELNLNLRETTTCAPTMIARLQEETAGQNTMRESGRLPVFRSSLDNS